MPHDEGQLPKAGGNHASDEEHLTDEALDLSREGQDEIRNEHEEEKHADQVEINRVKTITLPEVNPNDAPENEEQLEDGIP